MLKLKKFQGLNGTVCALYRAVTAIFGRIGRIATEDVVANEMYTSFVSLEACPPIEEDTSFVSLEACPLRKTDLLVLKLARPLRKTDFNSLDFLVNRFL